MFWIFSQGYSYSIGYVYQFLEKFPRLRLFDSLRLLDSLEYAVILQWLQQMYREIFETEIGWYCYVT